MFVSVIIFLLFKLVIIQFHFTILKIKYIQSALVSQETCDIGLYKKDIWKMLSMIILGRCYHDYVRKM